MPKNKILYFGNEQLAQGIKAKACPIFSALLDAGYELVGLILPTEHTRKPFPIAKIATTHNVPIFYTKDTAEIMDIIAQTQPEIGVLSAYSKLIPDKIIDAIPHGIINIHPSKLPQYRGTTPIESALLNGDAEASVSVMRLVKAMDAGPVYGQASVPIHWNYEGKTEQDQQQTTKQMLYEALAEQGAKLILETLPAILDQNAPGEPQNDAEATFTAKLDKSLTELQPSAKTAQELVREVVAFAGFPKSKLTLHGKSCTITAAHVAKTEQTELDQLCADGNYLIIDQLIPENSKPMDAKSFLNGFNK